MNIRNIMNIMIPYNALQEICLWTTCLTTRNAKTKNIPFSMNKGLFSGFVPSGYDFF